MKMIETRKDTAYFIEKAIVTHGNKYDYSKSVYTKADNKVEVICKIHGSFFMRAINHTKGQGCPQCTHNRKHSLQSFIDNANVKHENKYDYSLSDYKNNSTKIDIICKEHGTFSMTPNNHLNGQRCPQCKTFKLEDEIKGYLNSINIQYIREYRHPEINMQRFDFFLPEYNIAIECQGKQHYMPVDRFGGEKTFIKQQELDLLKKSICLNNGISLLEFPYFFKKQDKLNFFKQLTITLDEQKHFIIKKIID